MPWGTALVLTSPIAGNTAASGGALAAQDTGATLRDSAVLRNTVSSGDARPCHRCHSHVTSAAKTS
jgi:hypothetical protein